MKPMNNQQPLNAERGEDSLPRLVSRMGVTVAELKKHIADWPETDAMGEPTEVWLETGYQLSSPCMSIELLNCRIRDDGTHTSDLLLCPSETAWNPANAPVSDAENNTKA